MGLDQAAWQELTTWPGADPTAGDAWAILSSPNLPTRFRQALEASQHAFVRQLRRSAPGAGLFAVPEGPPIERRKSWNNRFANLVSGRFSEILFDRAYRGPLEKLGLDLTPTVERRDWHDYLISGVRSFNLAINVKNAGVQFRQAAQFVGMAAEETLPIATYKIFGSSAKQEQLPVIYVYLVDWTLISRLRRAYWESLGYEERRLFRLATTFKGVPRDLEDCLIEATVADRVDALAASVGYLLDSLEELPFRAISGARCKQIFYTKHERSPYVYLQRMNTDPNVHIGLTEDTTHFSALIQEWLSSPDARSQLITALHRTAQMAIPDPPI